MDSADLLAKGQSNVTALTNPKPRKNTFEIVLPRRYSTAKAPPLPKLRLLPAQDSTAYIIDRIFLPSPGIARDGYPLPQRMTYIVGWRDLPAARLLVPAPKVLDYVSPYELENWEWITEEAMEKEREKLEQRETQESEEKTDKHQEKRKKKRKRGKPTNSSKVKVTAMVLSATSRAQVAGKMVNMKRAKTESSEEDSSKDISPSRQLEDEFSGRILESEEKDGLMENQAKGKLLVNDLAQSKLSSTSKLSGNLSLQSPPTPNTIYKSWNANTPSVKPQVLRTLLNLGITSQPKATSHTPLAKSDPKPSTSIVPIPSAPPETLQQSFPKKQAHGTNTTAFEWEIQRLEDMQMYEAEGGGLVRYFRVRWAGNWPANQNPSWEPEENLPSILVTKYLKKAPEKQSGLLRPATAKQYKQMTLPWTVADTNIIKTPAPDNSRGITSNNSTEA